MRKGRIKRRWAINLLLVAGGVFVGLLITEAALRLVGYSYPNLYTTDQQRGVALKPGAEGWWRREGEAYIRINSEGLRDREHTKRKPTQTLRIAVLGDSYAEALQVPLEKAFWAVMEGKLRECAAAKGQNVEVINFGVSGYGTALELITLREKVWDYSPDIVLLAVTTGNDISDNSRALKHDEDVPYFVRRDGRLALDDSYLSSSTFRLRQSVFNRALRRLRDYSRVAQAAFQGYYALSNYIAVARAPAASPAGGAEAGQSEMIYREPADAVWQDAWQVTEDLLVLMRDEVAQRGAKFVVVTLSSGIQVHPDASVRAEVMNRLGVSDLFYPERRLRALGEREGFEVLNLA
ncbi:MAG TPA: SGNH/GDSL hydrolase family protein, partial [Pyrinomonadaceae bacterium]|nr:SGNH/GDSL hydrolase family protein [Pyrinomonadaceae bacterium]